MIGWYILDGKTPKPCNDRRMAFSDAEERRVAKDEIDGLVVSTVFLHMDHGFGDGPPLLFETMILDGSDSDDRYQERYSTWEEAEAGHARAVAMVRKRRLEAISARRR